MSALEMLRALARENAARSLLGNERNEINEITPPAEPAREDNSFFSFNSYSGTNEDELEERAAIVRLRTGAKQVARSPDWWRDEYEERAAIREFCGRYTRAEAERLAWGELENRWHAEYGERVPADICAGCRRPIGHARALDVADGTRVHGADCLIEFGKRWRGAATRALVEMGLTPPEGA